jgi:hemoglobin-like flavoprotein
MFQFDVVADNIKSLAAIICLKGILVILTAEEKSMIKLSFAFLIKSNVSIAEYFYNNLFEMAPLIKPMFKSDRTVLETHFDELITISVNNIDHFDKLHSVLFELGRKHKEYGVQEIHFSVVKSAFILAIQYSLKEHCSKVLGRAWSKYLDNISEVMIEGLSSPD